MYAQKNNYIKAIKNRLALTRNNLLLFIENAALKLQLEGEILKFQKLQHQFIHARSTEVPQPQTNSSVQPPPKV